MASANAEIPQALAVLVDHGATPEDQIVTVGHAGMRLNELETCRQRLRSAASSGKRLSQETPENWHASSGLPDRGVVKVVGDDARRFLNGLVTNDMAEVSPGEPRLPHC